MQYEEITLNNLFRHQDFHNENISEVEIQKKVVELKKEVHKKDSRLKWRKVLEEVMGTSTNLLNIRLKEILENAWQNYEEVKQYLDKEKFGTDETFLIPLVTHTIISEHHPKIEIRIGESYLGKIDFELQLQLVLKGVILKISQGKIQGVKAGKCSSNGNFSCEGITLFQDESSEFEF